jgi:hypothetical protein
VKSYKKRFYANDSLNDDANILQPTQNYRGLPQLYKLENLDGAKSENSIFEGRTLSLYQVFGLIKEKMDLKRRVYGQPWVD